MHKVFYLLFILNAAFAAPVVKVGELPKEIPSVDLKSFEVQKIMLGEKLFSDVILSKSRHLSCSSCHVPGLSFASTNDVDFGDQEIGFRNTPALINRYFSKSQMWDGRAPTLKDQIWMPIQNHSEMANTPDEVLSRLSSQPEYIKNFQNVFGEKPTVENVSEALAQFVSSNFAAGSRYDLFMLGNTKSLSAEEKRGMHLFNDKFKCVSCHSGFNFTNEKLAERCLREGAYVNKDPNYIRLYKVPTLRNLVDTAPYFHNGKLPDLNAVMSFYQGCQMVDQDGNALKNNFIKMTTVEKKEIIKFLKTLQGTIYQYRPSK